MEPLNLIIVLTLAGFLLLAAEVFVPGAVLGSLGGLCLIGAILVGFIEFGAAVGTLIFCGVGAVVLVGFILWMFAFPHTPIGRRIMLKRTLEPGASKPKTKPGDLLGQTGEALTTLRPAGTARIGGRKVDVVAQGDFIERGSPVTVIVHEGVRVVVRQSAG